MGKRGAGHANKKARAGAAFCQKPGRPCDPVSMNSLNDWCRAASLLGCLALSLEGFLFAHDVATQMRALQPQPVAVDQPQPALNQATCQL